MKTQLTVEVDQASLKEAIEKYEFYGLHMSTALRVAINNAGPKVRKILAKVIYDRYMLKTGDIKEKIGFRRASNSSLSGALQVQPRGLMLSRYLSNPLLRESALEYASQVAPEIPSYGIRVRVMRSEPYKTLSGDSDTAGNKPFFMVLKGREKNVLALAARRVTQGPRGGNIKVFHGPSISQAFDFLKEDKTIKPTPSEVYTQELIFAMRYVVQKELPREDPNP